MPVADKVIGIKFMISIMQLVHVPMLASELVKLTMKIEFFQIVIKSGNEKISKNCYQYC